MALRSISDLPGPRHLPLIGNAHQVRPESLHLVGVADQGQALGPG